MPATTIHIVEAAPHEADAVLRAFTDKGLAEKAIEWYSRLGVLAIHWEIPVEATWSNTMRTPELELIHGRDDVIIELLRALRAAHDTMIMKHLQHTRGFDRVREALDKHDRNVTCDCGKQDGGWYDGSTSPVHTHQCKEPVEHSGNHRCRCGGYQLPMR